MTRHQVSVLYVLSFLFAASVTTQVLSVIDGPALEANILTASVSLRPQDLVPSRNAFLLKRRTYRSAISKCKSLAGADEDIACPDINDPRKLKRFLNAAIQEGKPAPRNRGLNINRLSTDDRELLSTYRAEGRCPQSLRRVMPGFYELCLKIVVEDSERERGITHGAAPRRGAGR